MVDTYGRWTEEKDYSTYPKEKLCDYDYMAIWIREQGYEPKTDMENLISNIFCFYMRQFECVADKKIYTESQLQQLFQFKVVHGYDKKFEDWINEEVQNGYLRMLSQSEIINMHIQKYNRG